MATEINSVNTRVSQSIVTLAAITLLAANVLAQATASADSTYAQMLTRLGAGDTTIDFESFRIAYARSSKYDPMATARAALRQRLNAALSSGDSKTAALRADSLLASNYTDINAHVIRSSLAQQAADLPLAKQHAAIARGLVRSLDFAHRGASPTRAILLIDPDEENVYGMVTGLERTAKYNTAACGQQVCDFTVFHDARSGRDTTIVFDITFIAHKALGGKPEHR
jgi:hypothetical protein